MKRMLLLVLIFPALLFAQESDIGKIDENMAMDQADENGIVWFDVKAPPFRLEGFAWIAENQLFRRLPKQPSHPIRDHVDNLANHTSGGQVHFRSNSKKILIRAELSNKSHMYHMPSTGQSGFDLYVGPPSKRLYQKTSRFNFNQTRFTNELFNGSQELRNFVINFPLYNGVKSLEIGVEATSQALPALDRKNKGKIVVYGTSITQGGCAARPGLSYTNILSRRLDYEFINLGFSGNGRGEPELAHLISEINDMQLIILDYEANANEGIRKTLGPFVDILRKKYPTTPILIISKIPYAEKIRTNQTMETLSPLAKFQLNFVENQRLAGDQKIYFLNGYGLLGEYAHEATVDGTHPNSYGFMMMAENIQPHIEKILNHQSEAE